MDNITKQDIDDFFHPNGFESKLTEEQVKNLAKLGLSSLVTPSGKEIISKIFAKHGITPPKELDQKSWEPPVGSMKIGMMMEGRELYLLSDKKTVIKEELTEQEYKNRVLDDIHDDKDNSVGFCWLRSYGINN